MVGRALGVPARLAILIGAGTAICGNSAIAATAPVIGAKDEEVSFAAVTAFGSLAMLLYPLVGRGLGLSDHTFGVFAGSGVHDAAQAVAAGFMVSLDAGEVAAILKLSNGNVVTVGDLDAGSYEVEWWDSWAGEVVSTQAVSYSSGNGTLAIQTA